MENRGEPLQPLKIACTASDCGNDLHCFKKTKRMNPDRVGTCRACGADLVDWARVRRRDLGDSSFTFESLKREWIRHHFWHTAIDETAQLHARRKGRLGLAEAAEKRIRRSVGPEEPSRDGYQTPFEGNLLYYAQHALACCCRTCMAYWHGIPKGTALTDEQVDYFVALLLRFADERMPELTQRGERIPARRVEAQEAAERKG